MSQHLSRQLGLLSLAATGICSMIGASIYIVPFMVQRHVPGIGPYVWVAFLLAAVPALLAALAYAILASAMPRAGGSYVFASRGLHPYWGFVASFSQWFGLCMAIGVVSYVIVPFLRDIAAAAGWEMLATRLEVPAVRLSMALALLWVFVGVNVRGVSAYEKTLLPLMALMFVLGFIVIGIGFWVGQPQFVAALHEKNQVVPAAGAAFSWPLVLSAAAVLFASFIGFDSIAQAGGEAREPGRLLPRAIGLAVLTVSGFYFLFTAAVYHTVPWTFVAAEAERTDVSAAGLLAPVVPAGLIVWIMCGAAVALTNDLPAMLLSVSRLLFAWAADGVFPKSLAAIHPVRRTPHRALVVSGLMASLGILGCHFAGDFFLGVDMLVIAMLFNFLLMCVTVISIHRVNPTLAQHITVLRNRALQGLVAGMGIGTLTFFFMIHVQRDLSADLPWYFHSTWMWLLVMAAGSVVFLINYQQIKASGRASEIFTNLPSE